MFERLSSHENKLADKNFITVLLNSKEKSAEDNTLTCNIAHKPISLTSPTVLKK